jgi:hypothetical protein
MVSFYKVQSQLLYGGAKNTVGSTVCQPRELRRYVYQLTVAVLATGG